MRGHQYQDLINIFNACFAETYNTRLVKGDDEPLYLPADTERPYHAIYFAYGYFSSALHECSHWFIAGKARRLLVDYGYWYIPDGRTPQQQALFQQVEIKPQALEWILSEAAGYPFQFSLDNLNGNPADTEHFKQAVKQQVSLYRQYGIPARAQQFLLKLQQFYGNMGHNVQEKQTFNGIIMLSFPTEIILATHNPGKVLELQSLLAPVTCIPQQVLGITEVEESGQSFIENALLKARHASQHTNKPALADDSGLVVAALNGAPGIYSARYAGPTANSTQNMALLLSQMIDIPLSDRQAYFYCAIAYVRHAADPTPIIAIGQCDGQIHHTPLGDQGFGYDAIFYLPQYKATFAQLSTDIKNTISHRAQAMQAFRTIFSAKE